MVRNRVLVKDIWKNLLDCAHSAPFQWGTGADWDLGTDTETREHKCQGKLAKAMNQVAML
eukprot:7857811-Prorocentrum_lima.AAC.1